MDLSLFIESDNKEVQTISNVYPKYNYANVILSEEDSQTLVVLL